MLKGGAFIVQTEIGKVDVRLDRITLTGNLKITNKELEELFLEMPDWQLQPDYKADCLTI